MLKIIATVNNRRTLILGLDRQNTTRLHSGQPIALDLQVLMGQSTLGSIQDVWLCAGETLEQLHAELAQRLPLPPYEEPVSDDG